MIHKYTVIDLFAGAGGMTAGFKQAGFKPVFAVEIDPDAAATDGKAIRHSTIGAFKGLESDVVVFADVDSVGTREFELNSYVAASRPRGLLIVSISEAMREDYDRLAVQLGQAHAATMLMAQSTND